MRKIIVSLLILGILAGSIIVAANTDPIINALGVGITLIKSIVYTASDTLLVSFTLIRETIAPVTDTLLVSFTLIKEIIAPVTDTLIVGFTLIKEGITITFDAVGVGITLIKSGIVAAFDSIVGVFVLEKEVVIPSTTTACNPYSPNPPNGVSNILITTNLSWQCDSEGVNFDIYFGVCGYEPPIKVVSNQSSKVYTPVLQPDTCYCWRVISHGTNSTSMSGNYWQFSTLGTVELFSKDYIGVWENYSMYNKREEGCYQGESINMSGLMSAIPAFYIGAVGSIFWLFMFGLPFVAIWIKSESVIIPTILGFLISGSMFFFLPIEYQGAAQILFYISLAGLLFSFFKSRY